jgi:signal transduction histidine kinase
MEPATPDRGEPVSRQIATGTESSLYMKPSKYRDRHLSNQLATRDLQLQLAIDAAELGFWSWESLTGELVWSDRCRQLLGLAPEAPARLETFLAAIHPADRDCVRDAMKTALRTMTAFSLDHRVLSPDGRVWRLRGAGRAHASVIDGKRLAMTGFLRDMAEERPAFARSAGTGSGDATRTLPEPSRQRIARHAEASDYVDDPKVAWLPTARLTLDQAFGLRTDAVDLKSGRDAVERLRGQIRALISRLEDQRENERSELAGTLKSEILSCFTTIKLEIDALSRSNAINDETRRTLQLLVSETEGGLDSLRRTVFELNPPGIEEIGFVGALERYVIERTAPLGIRVSLAIPPEALMAPPRCLQLLYGVAQEAVDNVVRHASATQLTVSLSLTPEELRLRIVDDGVGIREDDLTRSGTFGLLASSERLTHAGGTLRISCDEGCGTTLEARVPT